MATRKQVAAVAAALSMYLEAEVKVEIAQPVNPWGWAARHELIGATSGFSSPSELPPVRR